MDSSCESGKAIFRPCRRICTSMSCWQDSSAAMCGTSVLSRFPERRDGVRGYTPRPEWERDFAFQIVIPANCLLFRTGIDDCFVVDAVFSHRISLGSSHDFTPRMLRTEVRPICRPRAISDLL